MSPEVNLWSSDVFSKVTNATQWGKVYSSRVGASTVGYRHTKKKICLDLSLYQHKTTNSNCVIDPMITAKSLKFSVGKNT